ncbi:MAG TPA: DNA repair protein RecO [Candidatus Spyradenecus faecavium]|uniref:DNA repair protein RecO n=1 Tax=Candidatus Spyradenecus faecavium TaxID=2840947 RepID=A0A9D1NKZ5_9BACT|nr:DNA repair protein RecO [Candidatus Spyradenecus faecavium]
MTSPSENSPQASPLLKSQALCLSVRPFSKTSQMVTWLTLDHGRVTTPVKGAQRPKSAFIGRYDVGYTCELVFYAREREGVHHIRECTPLRLREGLRGSWRAAEAAAYACDLTMRTAQPGMANPALFRALGDLLDTLPACAPHEATLALLWFESTLLHAVGLGPDFAPCPQCAPTPRRLFSVEEGRFLCEHRPSRLRTPPTLTLHDDVPALYRRFLGEPLAKTLLEARAADRRDDLGRPEPFPGIFGLRRFLGVFLSAHLDLPPGPRRTALDLLIG